MFGFLHLLPDSGRAHPAIIYVFIYQSCHLYPFFPQ
uniref:Uncharacterized protein n=1 Tax=Lepeophtheirus salmonis TaxID=72036 RepID=A0A0K2US27_LEPSM